MRLDSGQYLPKVLPPSAAPDIAAWMRLGFVYALIGVPAIEFVLAGQFISHAFITDGLAGRGRVRWP